MFHECCAQLRDWGDSQRTSNAITYSDSLERVRILILQRYSSSEFFPYYIDFFANDRSADLSLSLAIAAASEGLQTPVWQMHWDKIWQSVSSRAHEILPLIQHCKSEYIKSLDPMTAYIALLAASVLAFDQAVLPPLHPAEIRGSANLDLLDLFMRSIGQYWSVGTSCHLLHDT
jgi:hypothetical protein